MWVRFRKLGCGIERKWKGGVGAAILVPDFPPFPQGLLKRVCISGVRGWKAWFHPVFTRLLREGVFKSGIDLHGLHSHPAGRGKPGQGLGSGCFPAHHVGKDSARISAADCG